MATKIGGRARILINGVQYALRADVTIIPSDVSRESIVGQDGYHGVRETPVACACEFTLSDMPNVDIIALAKLTDATVSIQMDNGTQYVFRNAAQVNAIELNQTEGSYAVRFEGPSCVKA